MIDIKAMYQDLWNAMDGICDKMYLRSRPKSVDGSVQSYIVLSMPYSIYNNEMDFDGSYNDYITTVQIEIYARDRVSASKPNGFNVSLMDEKLKLALGKFPVSTERLSVTRPRVTLQDDDGDGFAVTVVQGRLRTK